MLDNQKNQIQAMKNQYKNQMREEQKGVMRMVREEKKRMKIEDRAVNRLQRIVKGIEKKVNKERKKREKKRAPKPKKVKSELVNGYYSDGVRINFYTAKTDISKRKRVNGKVVGEERERLFSESAGFYRVFKGFVGNHEFMDQFTGSIDNQAYFYAMLSAADNFLNDIYKKYKTQLRGRFAVKCVFSREDASGEIQIVTEYFNSVESIEITRVKNYEVDLANVNEDFIEQIENFLKNGSGWKLIGITGYYINLGELKRVIGRSYIPLPEKLSKNKSLVNIKNKGDNCFQLCIIANDKMVDRNNHPNAERHYNKKELMEKYNWDKLFDGENKWVSIDKIHHFERNNRVMVNVFYWNNAEKRVQTLERSKLKKGEYDKVVRLLLIEDEKNPEQKHYVLIRDFSKFFNQIITNTDGHKIYPCDNCLSYFRDEKNLERHIEGGCEDMETQRVTMLGKKENSIEFKNYKNKEYIHLQTIVIPRHIR